MSAQESTGYQSPDPIIQQLIDAPPTPAAFLSPDRNWMIMAQRPSLPGIEEVAQDELRLAGLRIQPRTNGSSRSSHYNGFSMKEIHSGKDYSISGLPSSGKFENLRWSPKGQYLAFTNTEKNKLSLWVLDIKTKSAKMIEGIAVNDAMRGVPFAWLGNSGNLIVKAIAENRGAAPEENFVPAGPNIQKNSGKASPVRTYQDLLKSQYDIRLFDYYASAELKKVNVADGSISSFLPENIYASMGSSPDGQYMLISSLEKPYSFIVPYQRFPQKINVHDSGGKLVKNIANIPLSENIPKGFGSTRMGPRSFSWRADAPSMLTYVEALDGGDPKQEAEYRDQLFLWSAPFDVDPIEGPKTQLRYGGVSWGNDNFAIISEWWWADRREITSSWNPAETAMAKQTIFDRSWEDSYTDPGSFQFSKNEYGRFVLDFDMNGNLYLTGQGASPEGNRPFLDRFDPKTGDTERLWRSEAPYYESVRDILDMDKGLVLTRRESEEMPANYYLRNIKTGKLTAVTNFENPYQALEGVQKELVKYEREDGVALTGTLYLPKGYDAKRDGRLPVLMWAYPREFKSADAAGQVTDSPYEFTRIGWWSPIFWVTQGYAVFDDFGMPIIGEGEEEPNEKFVEQLTADAKAAIDKLYDIGVADKDRLAVGGHSYGAFMTGNLLAHTDFFAAGIARSGAYNRTLTPFGFQSEERTFWETPETYFKMSPFMHADKIKAPLLMIHGEADNNSGTYPMQSERMFGALKGHGADVRLVMLPHESHGYRAKESIHHMLWEMSSWLDIHVKNRKVENKP